MDRADIELTAAEKDLIQLLRGNPPAELVLKVSSLNGVWTIRLSDITTGEERETMATNFDAAWRAARLQPI